MKKGGQLSIFLCRMLFLGTTFGNEDTEASILTVPDRTGYF
jgi:hypothetical protein